MVGRAFIGTSGWMYPHWRGRYYPAGVGTPRWLRHLSSQLSTVEINGTFYGLVRPENFARWRTEVGPDFVFSVKASRYITHMRKLGGGEAPLANFFAQGVLLLGKQLGPILWQLPATLRFDADRAREFLDRLPRTVAEAEQLAARHDARLDGRCALEVPATERGVRRARLRHALEVRHESWLCDEAAELLARHDVALVRADTAGHFPVAARPTARAFEYLRLHGSQALYASRYSDEELDRWADRIAAWNAAGRDVWVYFDNDASAYAPHDALRLRARLDAAGRPDPGAPASAC